MPSQELVLVEDGGSINNVTGLISSAQVSLRQAIETNDVQAMVDIQSLTSRIYELLRRREMCKDVAKDAAALTLRSARAIGEWAIENRKHGTNQHSGGFPGSPPPGFPSKPHLKRFRQIAHAVRRDEQILDDYITICDLERDQYPTIKGFLRKIRPASNPRHSSVLRPTENWNFNPIVYEKIPQQVNIPAAEDEEGNMKGEENHGYIPGDLVINLLWYWTHPGDVVVDLMAGSGMAQAVYDDREKWMPEGEVYDLDLRLFDINPRGPYKDRITQHDAREPIPLERAHYVFCDIPYYGMAARQYSDSRDDLANQSFDEWCSSMERIARSCALVQQTGDRVTIVSPNYSDVKSRIYIMVDQVIIDAFRAVGYTYAHRACASRHIQKEQSSDMARKNFQAKQNRVMLTEISYVITFVFQP